MGMLLTPLEQFQIYSLLNIKMFFFDFSFTNLFLVNIIVLFLFVSIIFLLSSKINYLGNISFYFIPNSWQFLIEGLYDQVSQLLFDNINLEGENFFPFISVLFCFILF